MPEMTPPAVAPAAAPPAVAAQMPAPTAGPTPGIPEGCGTRNETKQAACRSAGCATCGRLLAEAGGYLGCFLTRLSLRHRGFVVATQKREV